MDRSIVADCTEEGPFVSGPWLPRLHRFMLYQATVPKVNTAVPDDQYPVPNFAASVPEYLQAAVDGLLSQLERSVMLQVKSINSLKYVKPSPRRDYS